MFTVSGVTRRGAAFRARPDLFSQHPSASERELPAVQERKLWFQALAADKIFSREAGRDPEWLALGSEPDPGMFDAAVFQFALRLEEQGREEIAAGLYASLSEFSFSSELAPQARYRLETLRGTGGFGARAETVLRRFHSEALDPASLTGFFAGGLAYKFGRAWGLGRILSSGAGISKNGFLLRSLAATIGFGFEVPAFVLGARGTAALLGRPGALGSASLGKELAAAALVLGPMKLVAAGGASLAGRVWSPTSPLHQGFVGASAFAGIFLGHRLEQVAGLKPAQAASSTAFDSLVTLLQARVAGDVLAAAAGPRLRLWERGLELRLQNMPKSDLSGPGLPALAVATGVSAPMPAELAREAPAKGSGVSLMIGKRGGGLPKRVVEFDRGALAWGGEGALNWLLELRRHFENKPGGAKPGDFELWWIPESPIDTLLLNDFGVVYRRGPARLERINIPSRISLHALWPALRKGEAFVHTADLSSDLGRVLNKWTERENQGLQDLINAQWLELQFENLCRKKLGFVDKLQENGREYLLFEKGKRQILPPSLALFAKPNDPRSLETKASPRHFQNQYWLRSPTEAVQVFGAKFGAELPRGTVINHFLDPRAMMLPTWAGSLGTGVGPKFFFIQGSSSWMADLSGGQLRDVTAREPAERIAFLREISNPKPPPMEAESQALILPEISISAKTEVQGEAAGTRRYPSEAYPETVFNASTVPYPELFPKPVAPEVSVMMTLPTREPPAPDLTLNSGPTERMPERATAAPVPTVEIEGGAIPRVLPLPAPEPSAKASPTGVPVVAKDRTGLDPTLELTPELSRQMLGKKPLPFADTAEMSVLQMAEARRGSPASRRPGPVAYLASLGRDLAQAWRHRAWIWMELRVGVYRLIGRTPPPALVEKAQSYRESFKK